MKIRSRSFHWIVFLLFLGACTTHSFHRQKNAPATGTYLIRGDQLELIGSPTSFVATPELQGVRSLTYDSANQLFYALADSDSAPRLISIEPKTGEVTGLGRIKADTVRLSLMEGLAYDPGRDKLYAAGGKSTFASGILFEIDRSTAGAIQVAKIRGSIQNEVDAMTLANGELYFVDGAGNSSALYRLDIETGMAARVGAPFESTIVDLGFDSANQRFLALQSTDGPALGISLFSQRVEELQVPGEAASALEVISSPGGGPVFVDGFETGDSSSWSEPSQR